ncbi:MAG: NEW3 domain-containing protein [Desulfobacterales bacterium]|nr:NEW3 domain-containing protein [Desulfobacterales bacterium]
MKNHFSIRALSILLGALISMSLSVSSTLAADNDTSRKPARLITMALEYPGIEIPAGDDISMDIILHNKGRSDEDVNVAITAKPEGWQALIKTYKYTVTSAHVPSGEDKILTLEAKPPGDPAPGTYELNIEAQTVDGRFKMRKKLSVNIIAKEDSAKESKGVKLTTSFPVLQGPSDAEFEFSIEVDSKLIEDAIFDLFAQGPKNWTINFKPAYESKYISSLRLKGNQSQTVAVEVKPSPLAPAGEYPINLRVSSGDAQGEAQLKIVLTGTYDLEVGTPSDILSLDARQGQPANISMYIKNNGSAANHNISFLSFKPENWKVEFKPERIDVLEPGALQQIEVLVTPYDEALLGDYAVNIKTEGEKASKNTEFRITVKASAAWGWIGIAIIVLVIAGLAGLFRWLGRR